MVTVREQLLPLNKLPQCGLSTPSTAEYKHRGTLRLVVVALNIELGRGINDDTPNVARSRYREQKEDAPKSPSKWHLLSRFPRHRNRISTLALTRVQGKQLIKTYNRLLEQRCALLCCKAGIPWVLVTLFSTGQPKSGYHLEKHILSPTTHH